MLTTTFKNNWMVTAIVLAAGGIAIYSLIVLIANERPVPQQYRYSLDSLTKVDPSLLLYRPVQTIPTGLAHPRCITIDPNGLILVAGDKRILWFERSGRLAAAIDLQIQPHAVAILPEGRLYLAARDHVEVYDRSGQQLQVWSAVNPESVLTSIAVADGHVFVADAGNRVVYSYDLAGALIGRIGQKDPSLGIDGLVVPSPHLDLAVAGDGALVVANPGRHRLEMYTFDGHLKQAWGRFGLDIEGFSGCCNPVSIAILPNGGLVTCEKGLIRVKLFSADGRFLGVAAGPSELDKPDCKTCQTVDQCQDSAFDVAVDREGLVYVLDTQDRLIRVFQPNSR